MYQKYLKKQSKPDLRRPMIALAVLGAALLGAVIAARYLAPEGNFLYFAIALGGMDLLATAGILIPYLIAYRKAAMAENQAEHMTTEIGDMFRYVVNIPYAIVSGDGMVKIVSGKLQELLQLRTPICNVELSTFCSVPMEDVIYYAQNGGAKRETEVSGDGVPTETVHSMMTKFSGRDFLLDCYVMRSHKKDYYFVIFRDVTELMDTKKQLYLEDPIVGYIAIDNLEELAEYVRVGYKEAANKVEESLKTWVASIGGVLREYDKDKYVVMMNRESLDKCMQEKFPILENVRNIKLGDNSFPPTVSIGIGSVSGTLEEKEKAASDALDMALQKGGDQAAVNDGKTVTPFGGRVNTMYGSTAITSRFNSQYLCKLMKEAGNILIMGHRSPDYDSIGSCVGLARLAMCARGGETARIRVVINREHQNFRSCYDILSSIPEYRSMFISGETALDAIRPDTLLIMSDVSNPYNTEAPRLTKVIRNIAIVDHHRRPDTPYEFQPLLTYIRPAAAAAGELVTEMLEFSPYRDCLAKEEANLLLAGLMLDTKNFTQSAGTQTFSAVHFLYERGAHANAIRGLFTETMSNLVTASDIDSRTRIYRDKVAITWLSLDRAPTEDDSIQIAKAADKLMTVDGIEASFALLRAKDDVTISARSHDKINVQIIMKKLGGGGHFDMAGGRLQKTTLEEAAQKLKEAIDDYLDNEYTDSSEKESGKKRG